jgi:hypothetical protein
MTDAQTVAVLSLLGTIIGTAGGILAASKLVNWRLQQLEEKVNKHNCLIDRMYKVEGRVNVLEKVREAE